MPFSYTPSAASARNRRLKERESRNIRTSSNSRRPRANSRASDNRSPAPNPHISHSPLYAQENAALEQLPPLPSSGTASPSSIASPILQSSQLLPNSSGVYQLATTPHTPASLRKYLESEPELESHEYPLTAQEHEETSLPIHETDWNQPSAASPSSEKKVRSPSPVSCECIGATSDPVPSLPPPIYSTAEVQSSPTSPKLYSPTPVAPRGPLLTNPPSFTPTGTWQGNYSNEYQYPPTYFGPQYYGMVQPNSNAGEGQPYAFHRMPYFANRGSPHLMYDPMTTLPSQESGTASRLENAVYPLPITQYAHAETGDLARPERPSSGNQPPGDDAVDLLHRVQNAIPDLHLLLTRYRETSGQLDQRENLIRQTEAHQSEALRQKEAYIERLGKELELESQKHSAERSTLRLEIEELEQKHRELQNNIAARMRSKDELEDANQLLQEQNALLENQTQQALDAASKDLRQVLEESNQKELSIREELRRKAQAEEELQTKILEITKAHVEEREHLKISWARERRDIEKGHTRARLELEKAYKSCQLDLEKSLRKEQEGRERMDEDRRGLAQSWDAERSKVSSTSEQRCKAPEVQQAWEKVDVQTKLALSQKERLKHIEEENTSLKSEIEKLKAGWDGDKQKFDKVSAELRDISDRANHGNVNMQKRLDSFGDVTEFRGRGDPFYVDAFNQVRKQILELAAQHCKGSLGRLPESLLSDIPAELPDFSSDSLASIQLRAVYVQHAVWRILHQRIFQPFLFTLTRRQADADKLFKEIAENFRHDSWRRETWWRQQTLNAAYTASTAKQSINKVAAVVLEEIMEHIQYLTRVEEREQIKVAIRRIIKLSAETWRYVRLERELITASMPLKRNILKTDPDVHDGFVSHLSDSKVTEAHVILPLHPVVRREARHKELGLDAHQEDHGCTYLEGEALCSDSSMLMARLLEIEKLSQVPIDPAAHLQNFLQHPATIGLPFTSPSPVTILESAQNTRNQSDGIRAFEPHQNIPGRSQSTRESKETAAKDGSTEGMSGKDASGTRRRMSVSRASLHSSGDRRRSSMILSSTDGPALDWSSGSGLRRSGGGR